MKALKILLCPVVFSVITSSSIGSIVGTHLAHYEDEVTQWVKYLRENDEGGFDIMDMEDTLAPKFFAQLTFNKSGAFTGIVGADYMTFRVRGRVPADGSILLAETNVHGDSFSANLTREEDGNFLYEFSFTRNYAEGTSITVSGNTKHTPAATRGVDVSAYAPANLTSIRGWGICAVANVRPSGQVRVVYTSMNSAGVYRPTPPRVGHFYIDENENLVALLLGSRFSDWPGKLTISKRNNAGISVAEDSWLGMKGSTYRIDATGTNSPTHFVFFNDIFEKITIPIPEWPLSGSYNLTTSNGVPVRIAVNPRTGYLRGRLAPHSLSFWTDEGTETRNYLAHDFHGYLFTEGAFRESPYWQDEDVLVLPSFGGFRGINARSQSVYSFFMGFYLWDLSSL